jgi:hypothetical protein
MYLCAVCVRIGVNKSWISSPVREQFYSPDISPREKLRLSMLLQLPGNSLLTTAQHETCKIPSILYIRYIRYNLLLRATDRHQWRNKKRAGENIEYIKRFFHLLPWFFNRPGRSYQRMCWVPICLSARGYLLSGTRRTYICMYVCT